MSCFSRVGLVTVAMFSLFVFDQTVNVLCRLRMKKEGREEGRKGRKEGRREVEEGDE